MNTADFSGFLEQYHLALAELINGRPELYQSLYSRRDDVTLANPFAPLAPVSRGHVQVSETIARAASNYLEGRVSGFENAVEASAASSLTLSPLYHGSFLESGAPGRSPSRGCAERARQTPPCGRERGIRAALRVARNLLHLASRAHGPAVRVLGLVISLIGLYASFRANQRGDGVRFVERLVCLGFPVSARVLTAFYGSFWLLAGISSGYWDWPNGASRGFWAQWALVYLLASAFMWRSIRKYVGLAARTAAA